MTTRRASDESASVEAAPAERARSRRGRQEAPSAEDSLSASMRLLQRENSLLRLIVAIHDRLGALVLEGANAESITAALSTLITRPVLLLDHQLRLLSLNLRGEPGQPGSEIIWEPDETYVARVLQTTKGERRALRLPPFPDWGVSNGCVLAPVVVGDETMGYLAIVEPNSNESAADEVDLLAAQHAANVYALALMRQHITAEVSAELKDELIEGLLTGQVTDQQAATERLRRLGYDDAYAYRALILAPSEVTATRTGNAPETPWTVSRRLRALESVSGLIRERSSNAIVTFRRGELVTLLPEMPELPAEELARIVQQHITYSYPDWLLTIGIGGVSPTAGEIGRSYAQARRSVDVALRFGQQGQVANFESLGLYRLLFHVTERSELRAFVDQVLGPLLEYDRRHKTDFVHTAARYLANNNSLQATARELYVHVNTAAYRLQRIQAITGLDLTSTDDCLQLKVALMILEDVSASSRDAKAPS